MTTASLSNSGPARTASDGSGPEGDDKISRSLNVVVLDEELPYPPNSGKRIRTLNLVTRLARRHHITYLCHSNSDPREVGPATRFLENHGIEPVVVPRRVPPRSGLGFYARLALNLLSPLPYSVSSHASQALSDAIAAHAANHPVDLWHCEWTPYAHSLRGVRSPHLVMAHNVESLIWQRYFETEKNPLKRWYIGQQWHKFVRFEKKVLARADATIAVSPEDGRLLEGSFGASRVTIVDNGVDIDYFQPEEEFHNPLRILFLGSLDWRPNLDAVDQLLGKVFPAVLAREPRAQLWLVGRQPPESLRRQVFGMPNVELHADVADVRPFLNCSGVLAVPLRIGGGSRLKILEALACGLPVVSTRIGAEGLSLVPGQHLSVVDDVQEMAEALLECLRAPQQARSQALAGRQQVLKHYDWNALAIRLERAWLATAAVQS